MIMLIECHRIFEVVSIVFCFRSKMHLTTLLLFRSINRKSEFITDTENLVFQQYILTIFNMLSAKLSVNIIFVYVLSTCVRFLKDEKKIYRLDLIDHIMLTII
jgi:hypothetical protein